MEEPQGTNSVEIGPPADGSPDEKLTKQHSPGAEILVDMWKGFLFTLLLLGVIVWFEKTPPGEYLQRMAYSLLQLRLFSVEASRDQLPVAVVDITNLETEDFKIDGRTGRVTPRDKLFQIIKAVAEQGAASVAVDIDFSPDEYGYKYPRDPEFFNNCLKVQKETGVPIFLGAARMQFHPWKYWLGAPEYKSLAANIMIPVSDGKRMMRWTRTEDDSEQGPTLSAALASGFNNRKKKSEPPKWVTWAVEQVSERELEGGLEVGEFLVDYSPLEIIETMRIKTKIPTTISDQKHLLEGKMVLIGDGTRHEATDTFSVPGRIEPIPGIYLHACAAYTLIKAPLYEFTHAVRLSIDVALSVVIIATIAVIRLRYKDRVRAPRLQRLLTYLVAAVAFIVGVVFVRMTRLMWDDFILVIAALMLHPAAERAAKKGWRLMKNLVQWMLFGQDEEVK